MLIQKVIYQAERGWDAPLPGHMDGPHTLVIAFGAPEFGADSAPFLSLAAAFPKSTCIGCSTAGEISGDELLDHSLVAAVAQFESTTIQGAFTTIAAHADSVMAGKRLSDQLAHEGLRAVIVLADGLSVNAGELLVAMAANLPPDVVITGGLAGDGKAFKQTWVLDEGLPRSNRICAVGLYGEQLRIGHGCQGGWSDFGPERHITKAKGHRLYELDGMPALDLYKRYLGDLASGLPGSALFFPLSVKSATGSEKPILRTVLGVDEVDKSLIFAGDLPMGGVARLMRANNDNLIDSAGQAAALAAQGASCHALALSISCVARRLVLGQRTEEELKSVLRALSHETVHMGFYSYGEICPLDKGAHSELHNQTMTITVLSE